VVDLVLWAGPAVSACLSRSDTISSLLLIGVCIGRGGVVPFRAGDWKCGRDGCFYHNFAKNVSCLRCGAPRQEAAIINDGSQGANYHGSFGGPPPNMAMGQMGGSGYGGMPPGNDFGGSQMGGPPGAFSGQSFGPQSTYALPSGLGGPSPYMAGGYGQMPPSNGGAQAPGGFDSRAEQAFNQGNSSATGGAPAGYGGANGQEFGGGNFGGHDAAAADLSFLNSGMSNLALGGGQRDERRNGQGGAGATKSPQ
jgi:hypothetical protein